MPDRMPDRMPEDMSEYMPEDMPDRQKWCQQAVLKCHGGDHSK